MVAIGSIPKFISRLLFDPKFTEVAEASIKSSRQAVGYTGLRPRHIKTAFSEGYTTAVQESPSLWNAMEKQATSLPKDIKDMWKTTSGGWKKFKGVFKELGKRMPLIGGLIMVGFEVPTIYQAFKDKGIVGGVVEMVKSTGRLTGGMAGAAIGQALIPIPFVGGLIGWIAGEKLASLVTGKSYAEEKAEAKEQQNKISPEQQLYEQMNGQMRTCPSYAQNGQGYIPQMNIPQMTVTPQQLMMMRNALYGSGAISAMNQDFMEMNSGIGNMGTGFNMVA